MNDFVHSIPKATFSLNGQCLQIIQPTFGRLAFDAADDAAKRVLLAQAQANQSYPEDRKAWFLEYTERASDLDVKMPNENFAIVRSSSVRSTVEDVGSQFPNLVMVLLTRCKQDIIAVLRRSVRRFFFDESDIAAVQLAFATLRKEKNAAVRETMNDKAIDGNAASIEIQVLSVEDDNDVTFKSAWFHLTSHGAITDVLSHPTNPSDVMLEYEHMPTITSPAPNIGILSRSIAEETEDEVSRLAKRHQFLYRSISTSAPLQLSAWVLASSFPFHRSNPPLTPATARMDFEFSAVVAFILRRIVSNHVQYPTQLCGEHAVVDTSSNNRVPSLCTMVLIAAMPHEPRSYSFVASRGCANERKLQTFSTAAVCHWHLGNTIVGVIGVWEVPKTEVPAEAMSLAMESDSRTNLRSGMGQLHNKEKGIKACEGSVRVGAGTMKQGYNALAVGKDAHRPSTIVRGRRVPFRSCCKRRLLQQSTGSRPRICNWKLRKVGKLGGSEKAALLAEPRSNQQKSADACKRSTAVARRATTVGTRAEQNERERCHRENEGESTKIPPTCTIRIRARRVRDEVDDWG
ncbi:hypothetical protein EDB92DRAFT_1815165 [Lactarius akahatsu]|uniref:Uncharacterized protein n=1 Tax=Lactarius akahatsu TaxID=416441 RepID=A0AAD4LKQ6_9AGAM|nr:hypothetical protein EDB92DRAFT_1815165 [Lactarius akahatsu]